MAVVVTDPVFEADAAVGFGSEAPGVEEFVGEGSVEALSFAVGLGPIRAGAQVRDLPSGEQFGEEPRAEVGSLSVMTASTGMSLAQNQSWVLGQNPARVAAVSLSQAST